MVKTMGIRTTNITLYANQWAETDTGYEQAVTINGVTPNSKIDLQPSPELLAVLEDNEVTLLAANDNGRVIVYAVGGIVEADITVQALVTEVYPL